MAITQTIIDFVQTNLVLSIFAGILISLIIWKIRHHFIIHRNLSMLIRDLHREVVFRDWGDAEQRRQFQSDIASLADGLEDYHHENRIKNELVLEQLLETVDVCMKLANVWEVKDVTGPLDVSNTNASMNVDDEINRIANRLEESSKNLQNSIRISFLIGPIVNTLHSIWGFVLLMKGK